MKRTWTIIGVRDVPSSFKWYQSLFGQQETQPAHDYWGQILDSDGTVLLCLHQWGAHDHPPLTSPDNATPGNGLLLFFRVDDFDMALERARTLVDRFEDEPSTNANTETMEFSFRDPDGYYVTISSLSPNKTGGHEALAKQTPDRLPLMPVLPCRSIRTSVRFYTSILDFERTDGDDDPDECSVVILARNGDYLALSVEDDVFGTVVIVMTDNIDGLFHQFRHRGLQTPGNPNAPRSVHEGPIDQTWGTREFYVEDPDRNTLRFTQKT